MFTHRAQRGFVQQRVADRRGLGYAQDPAAERQPLGRLVVKVAKSAFEAWIEAEELPRIRKAIRAWGKPADVAEAYGGPRLHDHLEQWRQFVETDWEESEPLDDLSSDEDHGEHGAPSFGVRLKVPRETVASSVQPKQPLEQQSGRADQQENLQPFSIPRTCIPKAQSPAVAFRITESLLNLHTCGVQLLDPASREAAMVERGCQHPRSLVQFPVERGVALLLALSLRRAPDTRLVGSDQIQAGTILLAPRESEVTNVLSSWSRLLGNPSANDVTESV